MIKFIIALLFSYLFSQDLVKFDFKKYEHDFIEKSHFSKEGTKLFLINNRDSVKQLIVSDPFVKDLFDSQITYKIQLGLIKLESKETKFQYFSFNADSSYLLLAKSNKSFLNQNKSQVYIIDLSKQKIIHSMEFDVKHNKITKTYTQKRHRYYLDSPVKWLNNKSFIIATEDNLMLFNINDFTTNEIVDETVYSNFIIKGNDVISQEKGEIVSISIETGKITTIVDESKTYCLKNDKNGFYFAKGWSLYFYNEKNREYHELIDVSEQILDYWVLTNKDIIIKKGKLPLKNEDYSTYDYFNRQVKSLTTFDDEFIRTTSTSLSQSQKFFLIEKTKRGDPNKYVSVFDIQNKTLKRYIKN